MMTVRSRVPQTRIPSPGDLSTTYEVPSSTKRADSRPFKAPGTGSKARVRFGQGEGVRTCTVPGCERKHKALGYCGLHYTRAREGWDLLAPVQKGRVCKVPDCNGKHRSRGYCGFHYDRFRAGRDLLAPNQRPRGRVCSVPGCSRNHNARGYCSVHYLRLLHTGSLDLPKPWPQRPTRVGSKGSSQLRSVGKERAQIVLCYWPGCNETGRDGYCEPHREEIRARLGLIRKPGPKSETMGVTERECP